MTMTAVRPAGPAGNLTAGLDERDTDALAQAYAAYIDNTEHSPSVPLEGEILILPNGTRARVAHVWQWDDTPADRIAVQPSRGTGSLHLSDSGHGSYSGSLDTGIRVPFLTLAEETAAGDFWMWHHGYRAASNGVNVQMPVRVWTVNVAAARTTLDSLGETPDLCHEHNHPTLDSRDDTCKTHGRIGLAKAAARVLALAEESAR